MGGQGTEDAGFVELYQFGRTRVSPFTVPRIMANAGASHISMEYRHHRPGLHHFDRVLVFEPRHRPGVLDGALRRQRKSPSPAAAKPSSAWDF